MASLSARYALLAATLCWPVPVWAAATGWVGDANVAVRLVTATDAAGVGPVEAGLEFRYRPGWHGSWRSPGDAGFAPKVDWSGSQGIGPATLAWPAPKRLVAGDLQTFVYETALILPVTLERRGADGVRLDAVVSHAICGEICIPYRAALSLTLAAGPAVASLEAPLIARGRARVPGAPGSAGFVVAGMAVSGRGRSPVLTVDLRSDGLPFVEPDLFVEGLARGASPAPDAILAEDGRAARLRVALPAGAGEGGPRRLALTLVDGDRSAEFAFDPADPPAAADGIRWIAILATAVLGGLILNLMPCVLPVLSLKVFSLARHAGDGNRTIRVGMLSTAAGIVASFLAIAAGLAALQASGASIGWGIQFQQPWFLAGMAALTVVFAASLFDWVTIGLPGRLARLGSTRGRGPVSEAFLTGAFATLLATPCSAPFVGTAVGFALAQGRVEILATFAALGFGMALPYLAGAAVPETLRLLPRPGPWMAWLRRGLGLLLLATAAWLVWVLWRSAGTASATVVAVSLAALLAWLARHRRATGRMPALVATLLGLGSLGAATLPAAMPIPTADTGIWRPFEPASLPDLVSGGRIVVVDVTAAWCLTCKINDATTFSHGEVLARLERPDVVRMRADWTSPDPGILSYIRGFSRYGIPLVVVYGRGRPAGEALPELLTPGILLSALDAAGSVSADHGAGEKNSR